MGNEVFYGKKSQSFRSENTEGSYNGMGISDKVKIG
jgi:hypothetical protein